MPFCRYTHKHKEAKIYAANYIFYDNFFEVSANLIDDEKLDSCKQNKSASLNLGRF